MSEKLRPLDADGLTETIGQRLNMRDFMDALSASGPTLADRPR